MKLENLTRGATISGLLPGSLITVVDVQWHGSQAVELTYKDANGRVHNQLLYRDQEDSLDLVTTPQHWNFKADGYMFRLVSEAQRIRLAHLFDPYLAIHLSQIEPLPHQITAVYDKMLPRQPLRFLLADDPGAGKTIMAGLLIKELWLRGDLHRCLVVCPGNLVEQWQDELYQRFHLPFEIITSERLASARTGNAFAETPFAIVRLDKLARQPELMTQATQTDWDLIICDEAHKMGASFFGGEIKYTKRYQLGRELSKPQVTRHFLMLTATPHNGKEEDFQLFMALLDSDRFEGRFRDGVHTVDTSDLMRRMIKENLLKFDGRPLFPERLAYTVSYRLSDLEADLYQQVTAYVRDEFNRAESLEGSRRGTIGFALTILQRRLASSPEAIYQSLRRRGERLSQVLNDLRWKMEGLPAETELDEDEADLAEWLEDSSAEEEEQLAETLVDRATAARTVEELKIEIAILQKLEALAWQVRNQPTDRKWEELSKLLQNEAEMFEANGYRRKLIIFTEHRDTLNYLVERISALLGRAEAVATIHGGTPRAKRKKIQAEFTHDTVIQILVATDAAGEGINLQRAHLMINYDLPWNPNRLEQRFGRIHRIGQTEVCHLWNLVAEETRRTGILPVICGQARCLSY